MAMPMGDLLEQMGWPEEATTRIGALLCGCGFAQAIDAAMLDDDLIASIAESNADIRPLTLLWHAARPLIDGWAKGVTKFGLGRRVEEGGPGGPHGFRASPAAVPVGVEPVVGTAGSARASRLLRGFTRNNLRKFKTPRPTPPRPRVSMAEIEANRIEGAKEKIHAVVIRHFPTCRRLRNWSQVVLETMVTTVLQAALETMPGTVEMSALVEILTRMIGDWRDELERCSGTMHFVAART